MIVVRRVTFASVARRLRASHMQTPARMSINVLVAIPTP